MTEPVNLNMLEMARLIEDRFISGCRVMGGAFAGETWMKVEASELDGLKQIAAALEYLAPHADTIKRAIKGNRQ